MSIFKTTQKLFHNFYSNTSIGKGLNPLSINVNIFQINVFQIQKNNYSTSSKKLDQTKLKSVVGKKKKSSSNLKVGETFADSYPISEVQKKTSKQRTEEKNEENASPAKNHPSNLDYLGPIGD